MNIFGLRNSHVQSIYVSSDGVFWLGLNRGGINKYDKNHVLFNFQPSNSFEPRSFSSPIITSFAPFNTNEIFIGTIGAGLQLFNKNTRLSTWVDLHASNKKISNILILKLLHSGVLWIGTREDGIFQYDPRTKITRHLFVEVSGKSKNENAIRSIEEDRGGGKVWIGINGQGIKIFDPQKKAMAQVRVS